MAKPKICKPGIYFGMSDDEYHSYFALSSSGIKWLRVSPLDFYMRSALNPDLKDNDDDTNAKIVGRAYDKRIIEGKEAFYKVYASSLDPEKHKDALRTVDDLKAALEKAGQPVTGNKKVLIERLLGHSSENRWRIWDLMLAQHIAQNPGREFLSPDLIHSIEIAAAMIEKHPDLGKAFTGGMPKVAVFCKDPDTGIPMKAQYDYLKARAIVDLKTFANERGMPIRKAIARAVASYKYHVQCRWYLDMLEAAKVLIAEGAVFGKVDKQFLKDVCAPGEHKFLFVFQQKGLAPLARGMVLEPGMTLALASTEIEEAKQTFAANWKTYGDAPWLDVSEIGTFDSTEFPAYIAD